MILIIGGTNADILGFSRDKMLMGDSNPGSIIISPGGVGRNIAQALAALQGEAGHVELLTILSNDYNSRFVREITEQRGVSFKHSIILPGFSCPAYLAVMNKGDMVTAVNDMTLLNELTPERLKDKSEIIEKAEMVILDANLPEETIEWLTTAFPRVNFFAETVSAAKGKRFSSSLPGLYGIKPNRLEAEVLLNRTIAGTDQALEAAGELLLKGVKNVIITLGKDGSVYASREEMGHIPPMMNMNSKKNAISTNGAGDTYLAAAVYSLLEGEPLKMAAQRGTAAAEKQIQTDLGQ